MLAFHPEIAHSLLMKSTKRFNEIKESLSPWFKTKLNDFVQTFCPNEFRYGINKFGLFWSIPGNGNREYVKIGILNRLDKWYAIYQLNLYLNRLVIYTYLINFYVSFKALINV